MQRVWHAAQCGSCLQAKGIPLASNQVQYSLLYREPERNGVKKAIEDVGATLVAYSPLNQGLLTGTPWRVSVVRAAAGCTKMSFRFKQKGHWKAGI